MKLHPKSLDDMTTEEKVQRRIDRNRASAAVSRARKKSYIALLEKRVNDLECQIHELNEEKRARLWGALELATGDDFMPFV